MIRIASATHLAKTTYPKQVSQPLAKSPAKLDQQVYSLCRNDVSYTTNWLL